jgi:hypothetical protein
MPVILSFSLNAYLFNCKKHLFGSHFVCQSILSKSNLKKSLFFASAYASSSNFPHIVIFPLLRQLTYPVIKLYLCKHSCMTASVESKTAPSVRKFCVTLTQPSFRSTCDNSPETLLPARIGELDAGSGTKSCAQRYKTFLAVTMKS